jgi:hypothetical protein
MGLVMEVASAGSAQDADGGDGTRATETETTQTTTTTSGAEVEDGEHCESQHRFNPSTPRFSLSAGGGYGGLFVTWRQVGDAFMNPGAHPDGGYSGPVARAQAALTLGYFVLAVNYTNIFTQHDGTSANVDWSLLSGELGLQCACMGSIYVWGFGLELGGDLNSNTLFAGIQHRSQFFVWEGLFLGVDLGAMMLFGLTNNGASGGGAQGSLLIGYSLG